MKRILFEDYLKQIDKDLLYTKYIKENLTGAECASLFGVPPGKIFQILKYYNISKPNSLHVQNIKRAKKDKYGDENYNNPAKRASTNLAKYGVDNQFKREELKSKFQEQKQLKYGSKNNIYKNHQTRVQNSGDLKTSYLKQVAKTKETVKEEYGVDWASKSELVKDNIRNSLKETFQDRYGCDNYWTSEEAKRSNGSQNSHANLNFEALLKRNQISYEKEFLLENRYYDFKVGNFLIEINPTATHNSTWSPWHKDAGIDKYYHADKTDLAVKHGYRCIHIWDWDDQQKIINLFLKDRESIGARKCEIREVPLSEEIQFLNEYHLQGYISSKIALGLYYKNELVMLMTFKKPRYSKKYQWELLRLCSSKSIIGGASKLFNYFLSTYKPESIISYCDLSKFTGEVYQQLGFRKRGRTVSRHWYNIKLKDHITDKLLFKRGFDNLLGKTFGYYGKGTSNEALMLSHGFVEIWDSGQATYVFNYKNLL